MTISVPHAPLGLDEGAFSVFCFFFFCQLDEMSVVFDVNAYMVRSNQCNESSDVDISKLNAHAV